MPRKKILRSRKGRILGKSYKKKWKINRDYDNAKYREMRNTVRKRDNYKCQFPNCNSKNKYDLEVHHILRWWDFPSLRYDPDNAILLCKKCHKFVTGKEIYYAKMFMQIVQNKKKK